MSIATGARIVAADLRGGYPQAVIKSVDESVTSSTTLQNDDALFTGLAASATYLFACYLNYEANISGGQGFLQYKWVVPTGTTMRFSAINTTTIATLQTAITQKENTAYTNVGASGAGTLMALSMFGTVVTSTTIGTLQLQWAQSSSSGTATIVHAQSYLALWRIS